jgi:Protein of unknown function (DUF3048) N-terminal domain/Protein of unknown function (DUF3048) C-terminal domain
MAASLALTLSAAAVAACGSSNQPVKLAASSPKPAPTKTVAPTPTPPPTPAPTPKPPVVDGATYASPALVQIENLNAARPESGLQSANVVYEYSAEGGIGRFTAVYFSTPQGQVGPVRSARLVSPVLTSQYGGVLIYSGSSQYVFGRLNSQNTPRFDETSAAGALFRVSSRYAPHNLYTDGGRVDQMVHRMPRPPVNYTLWQRGATVPGGTPVAGFVVPVSPSERPSYDWHADLGGWTRTEPDTGLFTDANSGRAVVAPTVVVMQVPAAINPADIESGCCTAGWEYTLSGSGPAQVFTGAQMYNATWTQPDAGGPPQFTVAGGGAAPIAPGLVWIALVPAGQAAATR